LIVYVWVIVCGKNTYTDGYLWDVSCLYYYGSSVD